MEKLANAKCRYVDSDGKKLVCSGSGIRLLNLSQRERDLSSFDKPMGYCSRRDAAGSPSTMDPAKTPTAFFPGFDTRGLGTNSMSAVGNKTVAFVPDGQGQVQDLILVDGGHRLACLQE